MVMLVTVAKEKNAIQYVIQYLRGIAAILVVFHHTAYQFETNLGDASISWFSSRVAAIGAGGVDVFFVISGFIIFYTMPLEQSPKRAAIFLWHRFTRVVPLYWFWTSILIAAIVAGVALAQTRLDVPMVAASYLLVPYEKVPGNFHPILDQGWTLSFEMYFYALMTALIALVGHRFRLAGLFVLLVVIFAAARSGHLPPALQQLLGSFLVFEFFAGAAIASFFRASRDVVETGRYRNLGIGLIAVGASAFLASALMVDPEGSRIVAWGVPATLMVLGAVLCNTAPRTAFGRAAFWIGTASYSLYLTHTLFTITLGGLLKRGLIPASNPELLLFLATVGIVIAGSATYSLVERPLLHLFRRKRRPPYEVTSASRA